MTLKTNQETNQQLYYVKFPKPFDQDLGDIYLNLDLEENEFFINDSESNLFHKTEFTNLELDDIQERLPFLNISMLKVKAEDDK